MTALPHPNSPEVPPTPSSGGSFGFVINIVLFYAGWFSCVYALAWEQAWLGPLGAALAIGTHIYMRRNLEPTALRRIVLSIAVVMLLGPFIEGSLAALGVVTFNGPAWLPVLTLTSLWGVFATTFDGALGWLEPRLGLSILFGAVGAPPTYYAAGEIGALALDPVWWKWLIPMAVLWGLGFPALMQLARRLRAPDAVVDVA